jgi:NosR/NirI family transcriptional regulator, nitrous oxide reductase regulator
MFTRYSNWVAAALLIAVVVASSVAARRNSRQAAPPNAEGRVPVETAALLFPETARTFAPSDASWTQAYDASDRLLGLVASTSPFMDSVLGYAGPVPVLIGAAPDGTLSSLALLDNRETKGFVRRVLRAGFLDAWRGRPISDAAALRPDAVSGATLTCAAIADSLRGRLAMLADETQNRIPAPEPAPPRALQFGKLDLAILALLPFAVAVSLRLGPFRRDGLHRAARLLVQAASIALLGFVGTNLFSMSLLESWIAAGRIHGDVASIVVALLALAAPLATRRNLYCRDLCPFGACQELLFKATPLRRSVPARAARILRHARTLLLFAVCAYFLTGIGLPPDLQEPFSAFLWQAAGAAALAWAGLSLLLAALGFYRPWCTFFCSSGALLDSLKSRKESTE